MNILERIRGGGDRAAATERPPRPECWVEISESVSRLCSFDAAGSGSRSISVKVIQDSRPIHDKLVDSFLNKFFPSGYPYSVNEGYLTYTKFRVLQHFSSAMLHVLSTQAFKHLSSLTSAHFNYARQLTAQVGCGSVLAVCCRFATYPGASNCCKLGKHMMTEMLKSKQILKDGMQHAGKLICSSMGARMDSEPKSWRILADVLYDLGTALEVVSPLCPQLFLEVAGLGNFAKGMAVVAARATRLPIYSSFAKEGNLSDLFAKGEAISTLFNLIAGPLLSAVHIYGVIQEMRATPVNTLNPQRTAMIVADFIKSGKVSSPAELRYKEDLLFPNRVIEEAGSVKIGQPLRKVFSPRLVEQLRATFPGEKFLLSQKSNRTYMVLERSASGEDALRGWLVAAFASEMERSGAGSRDGAVLSEAYEKMERVFPTFVSEVRSRGWYTDQFLDGNCSRVSFAKFR
ncbi:Protein root UVB sensitive 2, chloroplastic [Zea mays]|uniref:Protein root UVB sensitive 2, chloroplastic n=1 Tax=Zea mays TaxID=4577 RepID=A0A3L6FW86_MAIZE|nr:Protein root UVB sensitive 2, chloroplastic [Zea mays]